MANEIIAINTALHAMSPDPRLDQGSGSRAAMPVSEAAITREHAPSAQELEKAVAEIAQRFEQTRTDLQFRMDKDAGRMVVSVVDARDGTVLRQLPSEVVLRIARHLDEYQAHLVEEVA